MMAVEPGIDAIALGEMGIGNTAVGRGALRRALRRRRRDCGRPRHRRRRSGARHKIAWSTRRCGCTGRRRAILRPAAPARRARIRGDRRRGHGGAPRPGAGGARRLCRDRRGRGAVRRRPAALDHCLVAHRSAEPGHRRAPRAARQDAAFRSRHAPGRGLGRDARPRLSRRRSPATPAWRPSPRPGSAGPHEPVPIEDEVGAHGSSSGAVPAARAALRSSRSKVASGRRSR